MIEELEFRCNQCDQIVIYGECKSHLEKCPKRIVLCEECDSEICMIDLETHQMKCYKHLAKLLEKLKHTTECKDLDIQKLEKMVREKDEKITNLELTLSHAFGEIKTQQLNFKEQLRMTQQTAMNGVTDLNNQIDSLERDNAKCRKTCEMLEMS